MLVDDAVIRSRDDGTWELAIDAEAIEVPPTIQSLLATRVERLPAVELRILELASVVGAEFSVGAIRELADDPATVPSVLERLRRKELVEPTGSYWGDDPLHRFHHVLIRDAAYRRLLKTTRAELHRRVGQWTDSIAGDLVGEQETAIAFHYEQAHRYRRELGTVDDETDRLGRRAAELLGVAARRALGPRGPHVGRRARPAGAGRVARRRRRGACGPPPDRVRVLPVVGRRQLGARRSSTRSTRSRVTASNSGRGRPATGPSSSVSPTRTAWSRPRRWRPPPPRRWSGWTTVPARRRRTRCGPACSRGSAASARPRWSSTSHSVRRVRPTTVAASPRCSAPRPRPRCSARVRSPGRAAAVSTSCVCCGSRRRHRRSRRPRCGARRCWRRCAAASTSPVRCSRPRARRSRSSGSVTVSWRRICSPGWSS